MHFFKIFKPKNSFLKKVLNNIFFTKFRYFKLKNFFSSYEKVDICLTKCESLQLSKDKNNYLNYHSNSWSSTGNEMTAKDSIKSNSGIMMNLRQVYAGLQFICKERRSGK